MVIGYGGWGLAGGKLGWWSLFTAWLRPALASRPARNGDG